MMGDSQKQNTIQHQAHISREEAARMVERFFEVYGSDEATEIDKTMHTDKGDRSWGLGKWHVGRTEFRVLLDAIYGPPQNADEEIKGWG